MNISEQIAGVLKDINGENPDKKVGVDKRLQIILENAAFNESLDKKPVEEKIMEKMHEMCEESLSPEGLDNWLGVKESLELTREDLKK